MAKTKAQLYNECKRCGIRVKRGVDECPQCGGEIVDQYGLGGLLLKHPERGIYALVGLLLGAVPLGIIALVLNDPTIGVLTLGSESLRTVALLCLLGGAVLGWFWPGIVHWLREHE